MRRWMLAVCATLGTWSGATVVLTILVFGGLQTLFPGFANASTVDKDRADFQRQINQNAMAQRADTNTIMRTVISGQILSLYATGCNAKRSGNVGLAGNIADQLSGLQVKYMEYSGGQQYPLQPCP